MRPAGKTNWFPSDVSPVHRGEYECLVTTKRNPELSLMFIKWTGKRFIKPSSLVITKWRGVPKKYQI